jgi:hypothetical protein
MPSMFMFDVVRDTCIIHTVSRVRVKIFDTLNRLDESSITIPSPKRSLNPSLDGE